MKIQIDGTNTVNKGAELMLYAILEYLEREYAEAQVIYVPNIRGHYMPLETSLDLRERKLLRYTRYPEAILRRLNLPRSFFGSKYASGDTAVVLDAGGFQFSDQWGYPMHYIKLLEDYYRRLSINKCKLIFLPQAFGPFKTDQGKRTVDLINRYAHLIIAREQISYDHLIEAGVKPGKLKMYPDFTLAVSGRFPEKLWHLKGKVCIIPNKKMITHTKNESSEYLVFIKNLIQIIHQDDKEVFLLNHEGEGDLQLCHTINQTFQNSLEVVSGLNARAVKGVIGASYVVISSRYHGVASALSQGVPCLSTSWNHKYDMLFKDYKLENMVLNVGITPEDIKKRIMDLMDKVKHAKMKTHLQQQKNTLAIQIDQMWEEVYQIMEAK